MHAYAFSSGLVHAVPSYDIILEKIPGVNVAVEKIEKATGKGQRRR